MLDDLVCVTHCLLVETNNAGLVLVDAGFSTQAVGGPRRPSAGFNFLFRPSWRYEETAVGSIEALSLDPREVRHIVLTHLDVDHADGVAEFPWATVHVYAPEWRALRFGNSWRDWMRYDREPLQRHERWEIYDDTEGEPWYGLRALRPIEALEDEFALVPLLGHSAGHCGVAVRGKNKWLLHTGDAYMIHDELRPAPYGPSSTGLFQRAIQDDRQARKVSLNLLSQLHHRYGSEVSVFCSHDEVEFERLVEEAVKEMV
jgi:glyoxylase-like metal-dependent hydrolase (beta-lactamase superfamily II)